MIVVRITGGLGNQMFQYAFARALQLDGKNVVLQWHGHRTKSFHNGWELDSVFEAPLSGKVRLTNSNPFLNLAAWTARKTNRKREPKNVGYSPECIQHARGYLDGYWQSEQYFNRNADTVRADFRFQPLTGGDNLQLQERIASESCVSIHVRRGDYINHAVLGGVCTAEYYQRALDAVLANDPECTPVVFSDDITYCQNLFTGQNAFFVDWNRGSDSWMDMALMSRCRHHIIANSSFSWWGAWLSPTEDGMTIAPRQWYTESSGNKNPHICPDRWNLMD